MTTLITGADGYLGSRIAAALPGEDLVLAVRCTDVAEFEHKRQRLATFLAGRGANTAVVPADLREPHPLAQVDPRHVTRIIHAAALIRFDVDRERAAQVNVAGTAKVRRFAEQCPRLQRLFLLSTLYAAGRRRGEVHETRLDDTGFVNHYEWSKWAAEECVLDPPGLPVTVARLPTVIAEDDSGVIGQHNAFHHTMRLFLHGLLTLLPGDPSTPLSLATASYTVDAVRALLGAEPGIYHLSPETVQLGTVIGAAFAAFESDAGFRQRMLPLPIRCDQDSFHDMVAAARGLRGGRLEAAVTSMAPFADQLYLPKVFTTERFRAAWPQRPAVDPVALVKAACTDLVSGRTRVPA